MAEKGEIKVELKPHGGNFIEVKITDTGKGIKKETLQKLFDPLFTTKEVGKGLGLGLYIVYGIIEQHKGKIEVLSEEGSGTTVIVQLPIKQTYN